MAVIFDRKDCMFNAGDLLWGKRSLAEAVVEKALVNQTEAFIDMIVDGQADLSRAGIQDTLKGVKEDTEEILDDMLNGLVIEIKERFKAARLETAVTGIKYDLTGEVTDIDVNVSVTFEQQ